MGFDIIPIYITIDNCFGINIPKYLHGIIMFLVAEGAKVFRVEYLGQASNKSFQSSEIFGRSASFTTEYVKIKNF